MSLSMKKYKNLYISLLILLVIYVLFNGLFPVTFALTLAFFVSYFLQKPIYFFYTKLHIPRVLSSVILLFTFILSFVLSIWFLIVKLYRELYFYYENTADTITPFLKSFIGFFSKNLTHVISKVSELFSSVSELFPKALIFFGIFFFATFYFSSDYQKIKKQIFRLLPRDSFLFTVQKAIRTILSGYLKLYFILFLFTFSCLFLSFTLLDITLAFTLAFAISLFDALPIAGIGIIMIPWGIFEYLSSDKTLGIWLIIVFAVITIMKEILKPKILGGFVGLHPLVSFVAISAGYLLMGVMGVLFMPFAVYVVMEGTKNKGG